MKGTHQGHNWNKPLKWDGRSDFMDAKRIKKLKKRKYPERVVEIVTKKNGGKCADCGEKKEVMKKHHVIPISEGGKSRIDNLILLCEECEDKRHGRVRRRGVAR